MRVCVYHAGALGDFVTILPLLQAWRQSNPQDSLVLLSRLDHGKLALALGVVDGYHDIESSSWSSLFSSNPAAKLWLRLGSPQVGLLFVAAESLVPSSLRSLGVSTLFCQSPFPPHRQHIVDYHFQIAGGQLTPPNRQHYRLKFVDRARPVAVGGRPLAVVHPGSGAPLKNWPLQRFVAVAAELVEWGFDLCWLKGPAEQAIQTGGYGTVVEPRGAVELAELLNRAVLYVGNDSGVSHCAAALGCGCVVLFGPSDAQVWKPFGRAVVLVRAQEGCAPCHGSSKAGHCGGSCMERIGVEQVVAACREAHESVRAFLGPAEGSLAR